MGGGDCAVDAVVWNVCLLTILSVGPIAAKSLLLRICQKLK